ncbi:MAG: polyprenyl synthetase family protein [Coriobacteriales bacterium]|jgi:geranylgeranyl diphosphate synthase type I|nr:polyprenyl synthetase family protein [Coriobacteriales bacterium]
MTQTQTATQQTSSRLTFNDFLVNNSARIDALVAGYYKRSRRKDLERYLYQPLASYSANGGKRHRPLLCELGCVAVGGDATLCASAAAAIEHFHTAALIHDDIADESTLRRGSPCLHISQGEGLAINAGDLALSQVTGSVLADEQLPDQLRLKILQELVEMTTRTIEGQALDIGWARDGRFDLSIDDYLEMATLKTAYYSGGTPLALGALIGGGSSNEVEALRAFGMSCGLAFQIQDDLLNLTGSQASIKKDFRSDITEGKRTLIVVHAIKHSPHSAELIAILASHTTTPTMLAGAVEIMQDANSLDFARTYAAGLAAAAKSALVAQIHDNSARALLLSLADYVIERPG